MSIFEDFQPIVYELVMSFVKPYIVNNAG